MDERLASYNIFLIVWVDTCTLIALCKLFHNKDAARAKDMNLNWISTFILPKNEILPMIPGTVYHYKLFSIKKPLKIIMMNISLCM
jgi:hypothetical protein